MKAEELRIGNYVRYLGGDTTVNVVSNGFISTLKSGAIAVGQADPIPLTEEWLVKCEFNKEFEGCFSTKSGFPVWKNIHNNVLGLRWNEFYAGTGGVIKSVVHLKYVHQLQNLYFALTGEELVIKHDL